MNTQDNARNQAAAQLASIRAMIAALNVDYDRIEELQDEIEALEDQREEKTAELNAATDDDAISDINDEISDLTNTLDELKTELNQLLNAADGCKDQDEARERIEQGPLEVSIRSDWYAPGETPEPSEFRILLCTGGPAVQIKGELDDYKQPTRAWLEYQDWFQPWTEYVEEGASDVLLEYAQQFYFGE